MKTYYASPKRRTGRELQQDIESVSHHPIIDTLMTSVSGLVAVLNEYRQLIAVNPAYLQYIGIENADDVLGMRPGESVQCVHASEMPGGCGTSRHCSNCGAAVAIVTSLAEDEPVERTCAIERRSNETVEDLFFRVRAHPMHLDDQRYTLLFIQDISREQQWANMERVFFHDVRNAVGAIIGWSELLMEDAAPDLVENLDGLKRAALRLSREIELQRDLINNRYDELKPALRYTTVQSIFSELINAFAQDPKARDKTLNFENDAFEIEFKTDSELLFRVINNMIINALEASEAGDEIRVRAGCDNGHIVFSVWNRGVIPDAVARRIFQRNFTTKPGLGRGLGTFSMKLLGEDVLHGKVDYSSSEDEGTEFRIRLEI